MAIMLAMPLCMGLAAAVAHSSGSCSAGEVCSTAAALASKGSSMIQLHAVRRSLDASEDGEQNTVLADKERARQSTVVSALECIDRTYAPFLTALGVEDAESVVKEAVSEAMAMLTVNHTEEKPTPTLDEASAYLWKSYSELVCALSPDQGCTLTGFSFDDIRGQVQTASTQSQGSLFERAAGQATVDVSIGSPGPRCRSTLEQTVQDSERHHRLEGGSLAALASSLQALRESGIEEPQILRLVSLQAGKEAMILGSPSQDSMDPLPLALAHVLLSHSLVLRALGEPANLEIGESLQANADILLGRGSCLDTAIPSGTAAIAQVVRLLVPQYMQLQCAVNTDCHTTYTHMMAGGVDNFGPGFLQESLGTVMKGGRFVAKGLVLASMRLFGLQRFDVEVLDARATAVGSFEVSEHAEYGEHLAAAHIAVKSLLQQKQVRGAGHLIRVAADIMRCPNV